MVHPRVSIMPRSLGKILFPVATLSLAPACGLFLRIPPCLRVSFPGSWPWSGDFCHFPFRREWSEDKKRTLIIPQLEAHVPVTTAASKEGTRTWVSVMKRMGLSTYTTSPGHSRLKVKVTERMDLFSSKALQERVRTT